MLNIIKNTTKLAGWTLGALIIVSFTSTSVIAGPTEQAIKLHRRLASVQPDAATITQMAGLISAGDTVGAAKVAMSNRYFYDLTIKNWAATWTNENQDPVVQLNDAIATIIGVMKDNKPFTDVLKADVVYTAAPGIGAPPYSKIPAEATAHYEALETSGQPLADNLVEQVQSAATGIPDTAGILTTQAWGDAFFKAGTNRRVFRFAMINFMCTDLEGLLDTTMPAVRIRRDVDRAPGGDPSVFKNKCLGCHSLQDSAIGAASFFDYDEDDGLLYTPGVVPAKVNRGGIVYPAGYVTVDDSWMYMGGFSTSKALQKLGWRGATEGNGMRSLASAISESRGFSECMVKRVFHRVCLREPGVNDKGLVRELADQFEAGGAYNMTELFAQTASKCIDME